MESSEYRRIELKADLVHDQYKVESRKLIELKRLQANEQTKYSKEALNFERVKNRLVNINTTELKEVNRGGSARYLYTKLVESKGLLKRLNGNIQEIERCKLKAQEKISIEKNKLKQLDKAATKIKGLISSRKDCALSEELQNLHIIKTESKSKIYYDSEQDLVELKEDCTLTQSIEKDSAGSIQSDEGGFVFVAPETNATQVLNMQKPGSDSNSRSQAHDFWEYFTPNSNSENEKASKQNDSRYIEQVSEIGDVSAAALSSNGLNFSDSQSSNSQSNLTFNGKILDYETWKRLGASGLDLKWQASDGSEFELSIQSDAAGPGSNSISVAVLAPRSSANLRIWEERSKITSALRKAGFEIKQLSFVRAG